jgi:iron(III) transport system permease protein
LYQFFVSPIILVFGYILMYGPQGYITSFIRGLAGGSPWNIYSIPAMAWISAISTAPIAFLYCSSSVVLADPTLEDAARIAGAGPYGAMAGVTIPLLRPSLLFSAVLIFTAALETFSVPVLLGKPERILMFTTFLYEEGISNVRPDYGLVSSGAVIVIVIVTGMIIIQERLLRNVKRFITIGGKATRPRKIRLGKMGYAISGLLFTLSLAAILLPIGGVILRSFVSVLSPYLPIIDMLTFDNFIDIINSPESYRSIINTMNIAVLGGAIASAFLLMIALISRRSNFRYRSLLAYVAFYPRAVPSIIIGFGFFVGFLLFPMLAPLRSTIWVFVIVYTVRHLPTGFGLLSAPILRISEELDNAVRISGGDWWSAVRHGVIPLLKPATLSAFVLLMVTFFKEYPAAIFLMAPGSEVAGVVMLHHWFQGEVGLATAISVVQLALIAIFVVIAGRILKVKIYE